MRENSITYLMSGPAHLPYLVVSLRSLRETGWDGDVLVGAWPESYPIATKIAEDLGARCLKVAPNYKGKNAQFLHKQGFVQTFWGQSERVLYVDADTLFNRDPSPLLEIAKGYEFTATQFNSWTTHKRTIQTRVNRLYEVQGIPNDIIRSALNDKRPSLNGGVFACCPQSKILRRWIEWSWYARRIFIADETVLHVLPVCFNSDLFHVVEGGEWNASPKFFDGDDPVIWHFHGDSNVRLNKSKRGIDLWWPKFQACLSDNTGGVCDWIDMIPNRHLKQLREVKESS